MEPGNGRREVARAGAAKAGGEARRSKKETRDDEEANGRGQESSERRVPYENAQAETLTPTLSADVPSARNLALVEDVLSRIPAMERI